MAADLQATCEAIDRVTAAFRAGHAAIRLSGRSLHDFVVDDGVLRPLIEALRIHLHRDLGMVFVRYSLAGGIEVDRYEDSRDREAVERALRAFNLHEVPPDANEVVRVIRGMSQLAKAPTTNLHWADGHDMRFAFVLEFAEHLTPGSMSHGSQTDAQLVAAELAFLTAQSLSLRASGNLVIFAGREGLMDEMVESVLHRVHLAQPSRDEKRAVVDACSRTYDQATLETGLDADVAAHLTMNTPNRGLESLYRASHRSKVPITAASLVEQKAADVATLSEGTLRVLDASRVNGVQLEGRNVAVPLAIMGRLAALLRTGNSQMPANVLLAGAPGTGKTDLAIACASDAKVSAFEMLSPKGSLVGQTERNVHLQQRLLGEMIPSVAFADEISESLPMERSGFDGDSGASRAVMAALLTSLSNEGRRGRSLLVATTNCPWRIGAAMRTRFVVIPVLQPLAQDVPGIIVSLARHVDPAARLEASASPILEAARIFHAKRANPRELRAALTNAALLRGTLDAATVLFAANDFVGSVESASADYADLWAIRCCSSRSYLPWSESPSTYPFPDYLRGIVDTTTGDVDPTALKARIDELRPHANV